MKESMSMKQLPDFSQTSNDSWFLPLISWDSMGFPGYTEIFQ